MPKSAYTDELEAFLTSEEGMKELTQLARSGLTLQEIATHYDIHRNTLYIWSKKHQEVLTALNEGKKVADDRVEQSLYEQCFTHTEKIITIEKDAQGNIVKQTVKTQLVPANITAIQYWLSNRQKDKWKARQQLEVGGSDELEPIVIVNDLERPKIPDLGEESSIPDLE